MHIVPLEPNDDIVVEQWLSLWERSLQEFPLEPPISRRAMRSSLTYPNYGEEHEIFIARQSGAVVGVVELSFPMLDNLDNATFDLLVEQDRRREGIGRMLFDHAAKRARKRGRVRMIGESREPFPDQPDPGWGGVPFLESVGATRALADVRRRLDFATLDDARLVALDKQARNHASGYRIVDWSGAAPDEFIDGLAVLSGRMVTDAPMGDLKWEPEAVDRDRLRGVEKIIEARGRRSYTVAAIHDATGEVAGTSRAVVDPDVPQHVWQWDTIVLPDHRGHRLGLAMKLANLDQLRRQEPAAAQMDTWNAAQNAHMIKVNEAMGFEPIELWAEWQVEI